MNEQTENSIHLYKESKKRIGTPLVKFGINPVYGCASSLNSLNKLAFPHEGEIGGGASTYELLQALIKSVHYFELSSKFGEPLPGDIIISATGTSTLEDPEVKNGHCGVVGKVQIMSNNSMTGLWDTQFVPETWRTRYEVLAGIPTRYFRHI